MELANNSLKDIINIKKKDNANIEHFLINKLIKDTLEGL